MTTEERYELIYGNTARAAQPVEKPKKPQKDKKRERRPKQEPAFDFEWRSLRLYAAILLLVAVCISYIHINAANIQLRKEIAVLKNDLNAVQIENDDLEDAIYSEADLNEIKETAMNKLGMVKPKSSHVIKYSNEENDYVRQYDSIPE
ncbi:MAG: septum formation initiator family protein [Lachnospiraceae bacterium]|nr:septum formation initiator family protein [Lachnospiraceae bacterium]